MTTPDLSHLRISFLAGTLARGGSERQLFYMTRALRRAGATTQVLSLTDGEFWQEKIEAAGTPVRWVGRSSNRMGRLAAIIAALREFRPSFVQSQHFYTNPYVLAAARWLRLPEVGAIRGGTRWSVTRKAPMIRRYSLLSLRRLVSNSSAAIREAIELGVPAERLTLIPNVIDTNQFCPAGNPPGGPLRILGVGRLGPEKRFDLFLRVLARVCGESPQAVTGRIVGAGVLAGELEAQAASLGLTPGRMEFSGVLADMVPVYQDAAMLVLTSDSEGTPNVVLEAMSCGLPVVATRVGGVPDLVQHGQTGFLCDVGDEEAIAASVLQLASDSALRRQMGARARAIARDQYHEDLLPIWLGRLYGVPS